MTDDYAERETRRINRRTVLQTAGLLGASALGGVAAAQGRGQGNGSNCDIECSNEYVKYELVELDDGTCEFEEETDTGIYGDSLTITACKDGETAEECEGSCEPLAVSWDNSAFETTTLVAKGSTDCETAKDPNGSYESDLENPNNGRRVAISNLQFCVEEVEPLECPDGTAPLARYDVDGDVITYDSGEDVVEFSNKDTDSNGNLVGFDFNSIDGSDDNSEPETLTTVTVEYDDTVETFEVDPNFDTDKQSGSVSVDGPINRVLFCQAVYAQADFATGDVTEDLCNNQISGDKISSVTWSSYNGQLNGVQGQFDGSWDIGTQTVTVNYNEDYDGKVSLAVYSVDDPNFQDNNNISFSDTRCRQTLVDSDTDEVGDQDGTLTADLPSV